MKCATSSAGSHSFRSGGSRNDWSRLNGTKFDSSRDRDKPFDFPLGKGQVIKGWDMGLVGMRVGGRRELIIPPSLGYGASSQGPSIAANDTLIFVVDLQKIG